MFSARINLSKGVTGADPSDDSESCTVARFLAMIMLLAQPEVLRRQILSQLRLKEIAVA
jgi:hypothetical protein